jgi:P2-related tail formation protein
MKAKLTAKAITLQGKKDYVIAQGNNLLKLFSTIESLKEAVELLKKEGYSIRWEI